MKFTAPDAAAGAEATLHDPGATPPPPPPPPPLRNFMTGTLYNRDVIRTIVAIYIGIKN